MSDTALDIIAVHAPEERTALDEFLDLFDGLPDVPDLAVPQELLIPSTHLSAEGGE